MSRVSLTTPYTKFVKETHWLLSNFERELAIILATRSGNVVARMNAEMTVVRLHDAWARFCREIVVLSAGSRPYCASGARLPYAPGINCCSDVIPVLLRTFKKRKMEPRWASPFESIDAAQRLRVANFYTLSASLGAVGAHVEELRLVRNFLVHKCRNTVEQINQNPSFLRHRSMRVEDLAADILPGGIIRIEKWVDFLRSIAMAAIQ